MIYLLGFRFRTIQIVNLSRYLFNGSLSDGCCVMVSDLSLCLMFPDMQQRRIPTSVASAGFLMPPTSGSSGHSMPPGAVGSSTRDRPPVNNYNHLTEQALLRSAAREHQPHLHPKKANGALW